MTHSVQLLIGRGEAVAAFLRVWPARTVELKGGWLAIPIEEALYNLIEAKAPGAKRSPELDGSPLGLELAMAAATEAGGGLAYIETDYWGGEGGQSAMAFVDGRERMAAQRSRGAGGPINQALRAIGVERVGEADAFDTIGLGERRTMDDYAPEGPRRLRGAQPVAAAEVKRSLPVWLVLLLVVGAIALGVVAALPK